MSLFEPTFALEWPRRSLWDTATWVNGLAFRSTALSDAGDPVIKIAELKSGLSTQTKYTRQSFDDKYRVRPGDVLYSWSGSPDTSLDVFVWDGPEGWLNQHIFKISTDADVDRVFHIQLLRYLRPNLVAIATNKQTTGLGHVTQKDMRRIVVAIPPLDEQRRIAALLGALDDKIELNRKMNRTLEEIAQAIFKSWFIDFDGVPPEDFVDSDLGVIPKDWEVTSLRDHITLDKGLSYKGKFLTESGVPMVNLKCVRPHGGFRRDATKPYSGDFKPRHVVRSGDLIIANTDLTQARDILGCPAFVPKIVGAETIITSHHTFAVRFHDDARVERHYLYHLLLSPTARRRCRGFATGTTVLAVPRDALLDFEFALPPAEQLMEFEHIARVIRGRIETSVDESETLARTRDTLLPKLISGEIRVPEAVEQVGAAL